MDFDSGVAYQEMQEEQDTQKETVNPLKAVVKETDYKNYLKSLSSVDFFSLSIEERDKIKRKLDEIATSTHEYDDWIERIHEKMNLLEVLKRKHEDCNKVEFLEHLNNLKFSNLDIYVLNYIRNIVNNDLSSLEEKATLTDKNDILRLIFILSDVVLFVLTGCSNFLWLIAAGSFGIGILSNVIKKLKEYKKYKLQVEPILGRTELFILGKGSTLNSSLENTLEPHVEPVSIITNPKIKNLSEEQVSQEDISLASRINMLESKILLLPKEEESPYQERLQKALSDLEKSRTIYSACEIQLLLCDKSAEIYTLERELDAIERDLNSKSLFVTKEDFEIEISKKVETYLTNIGAVPMEDKWQTFGELRSSLLSLLNSEDIVRNLSISRAFAECFWETYLNANAEDEFAFRDLVCEEFIDAVILEGERILDNLEQDINVITIRSKLNQMKSCCSKREYLKYLAQDVRLTKSSRKLVRKNSDFHS